MVGVFLGSLEESISEMKNPSEFSLRDRTTRWDLLLQCVMVTTSHLQSQGNHKSDAKVCSPQNLFWLGSTCFFVQTHCPHTLLGFQVINSKPQCRSQMPRFLNPEGHMQVSKIRVLFLAVPIMKMTVFWEALWWGHCVYGNPTNPSGDRDSWHPAGADCCRGIILTGAVFLKASPCSYLPRVLGFRAVKQGMDSNVETCHLRLRRTKRKPHGKSNWG